MDSKAWAQLVSLTEMESSEIPIFKDKFVIGRNNDCDLPHVGNKLVSGTHCYIERDSKGKVWLQDTSTNGTLLNMSIKLSKGDRKELLHGDEIHIVHKKHDTSDDIGYMFQDIEALRAELSSDLEVTQEYTQVMDDVDATLSDENVNTVTTPSPLKKRKSAEVSPVVNKRIKKDSQVNKKLSSLTGGDRSGDKSTGSPAGTFDADSDKPDKIPDNSDVKQQVNDSEKSMETAVTKPIDNPAAPVEPKEDAIAETLVCIICQELLYDCISLQPCMHSFCAGCYSEWMERSQECPSCRVEVARINKNHIVNNLVEAYLKTKPDKRRPETELKELDAKNKITRDMLYPVVKPNVHSDGEPFNESYSESDDGDDTDYTGYVAPPLAPILPFNQGYGFGTPFYPVRPAQTVCRQCTGYTALQNQMLVGPAQQLRGTGDPAGATCAGPSTGAGPSTAADDPDAKTFPVAPYFVCPMNGNHVLCNCCMLPMPDRRHQYTAGGLLPPQQCFLCLRSFCHAYWGCQKADCHGCLAKFKDLNFGTQCLASLILDNGYESKVLADYIRKQGITVKDLFKECLTKLSTGEYVCTNQARITSQHGLNTPVCYGCGMQAFKELAYFYRRDIPADKLPKEVTSRPACHWGKNCRTQKNKPEHAARYNHICYQLRLTNT